MVKRRAYKFKVYFYMVTFFFFFFSFFFLFFLDVTPNSPYKIVLNTLIGIFLNIIRDSA